MSDSGGGVSVHTLGFLSGLVGAVAGKIGGVLDFLGLFGGLFLGFLLFCFGLLLLAFDLHGVGVTSGL